MKQLASWRAALAHPYLIGLLFVTRSALATLLATLCLGVFSPRWIMGLPKQEQSLFEPGLNVLLRLFSDNQKQWGQLAGRVPWFAACAAATGAVVVTYVLHALGRKQSLLRLVRSTFSSTPRQLVIVAAHGALVFFVIGAARRLSHVLPAAAYSILGEKGADAVLVLLWACAVAAIVFTRIACDLIRVGAIESSDPILSITAAALADVRERWRFWGAAYAGVALPTLLLPALVEWCFPTFGSAPSFGFWPTLVHQVTIVLLSALQLSWWVLVRSHAPVPARP